MLLLVITLTLGIITGFAVFSEGNFFKGLLGQIVQGLLCIGCFVLVGIAVWIYNWKLGVLTVLLVFVGSNAGLSMYRYLRRRSGL